MSQFAWGLVVTFSSFGSISGCLRDQVAAPVKATYFPSAEAFILRAHLPCVNIFLKVFSQGLAKKNK